MKRDLKQKLERLSRYQRRSLLKNNELKQDLVKYYTDGLLFDPEATYALRIACDFKVRDFFNMCTEQGFNFVRDPTTREKKYHGLKQVVSEFKFVLNEVFLT